MVCPISEEEVSAIAAHLKLRTIASQRKQARADSFGNSVSQELVTAVMVDCVVNGVNPDIAGLALAPNSL